MMPWPPWPGSRRWREPQTDFLGLALRNGDRIFPRGGLRWLGLRGRDDRLRLCHDGDLARRGRAGRADLPQHRCGAARGWGCNGRRGAGAVYRARWGGLAGLLAPDAGLVGGGRAGRDALAGLQDPRMKIEIEVTARLPES